MSTTDVNKQGVDDDPLSDENLAKARRIKSKADESALLAVAKSEATKSLRAELQKDDEARVALELEKARKHTYDIGRVNRALFERANPGVAFTPPQMSGGDVIMQRVDGRHWWAFLPEDSEHARLLCSVYQVQAGGHYPDRDEDPTCLRIEYLDARDTAQTLDVGGETIAVPQELKKLLRKKGIIWEMGFGDDAIVRHLTRTQPAGHAIYDRSGFRDGAYICPTGEVLLTNRPIQLSERSRLTVQAKAGSSDGWETAAATIINAGAPYHTFGVLVGFTGPLVDLTGSDSISFLLGGESKAAKSTIEKIAVTPFCAPDLDDGGLNMTSNTTKNAVEIPLQRSSGAIACFDEVSEWDAKDLESFYFKVQGGHGKRRMKTDGGGRQSRGWSLTTLSSQETDFGQRLAEIGRMARAGLMARVTTIRPTHEDKMDKETWDKAKGIFDHYGHAIKPYVEHLKAQGFVSKPAELMKLVEARITALAGASDDYMRESARNLAFVWMAGDLLVQAKLLPETFNAEPLVRRLWREFKGSDLAPEDVSKRAIRQLMRSLGARRGLDVIDWTSEELSGKLAEAPPSSDRVFREPVAWVRLYQPCAAKPPIRVYVVRTDKLSELSGNVAETRSLRKALVDAKIALKPPRTEKGKARVAWERWPGLEAGPYMVFDPAQFSLGDCADLGEEEDVQIAETAAQATGGEVVHLFATHSATVERTPRPKREAGVRAKSRYNF